MKKERDAIDLALEFFNLQTGRDKVTLNEVETIFHSTQGSYVLDDQQEIKIVLRHFQVLKDFIQNRGIASFVQKFRHTYRHEIDRNSIDPLFLKQFGSLEFEARAERLMDKKFAYYFLDNLKRCGYSQCMRYGNAHRENTSPAMTGGDSRIAALLLYTDNDSLPPLLIELGNKNGGIQVGETMVSTREGALNKENVSVFKLISDPSEQQIRFIGSEVTGIVPDAVKGKFFTVTEDVMSQIQECVQEALNVAIHKMPSEMKSIAEKRANTIVKNSSQYGYSFNDGESTEENKTPPAVRSWKREEESEQRTNIAEGRETKLQKKF